MSKEMDEAIFSPELLSHCFARLSMKIFIL
ncbi:MAG: hypothetical protein EZS28_035863, partial [Streblomastix strix]